MRILWRTDGGVKCNDMKLGLLLDAASFRGFLYFGLVLLNLGQIILTHFLGIVVLIMMVVKLIGSSASLH